MIQNVHGTTLNGLKCDIYTNSRARKAVNLKTSNKCSCIGCQACQHIIGV